jgi:hypothetical protein
MVAPASRYALDHIAADGDTRGAPEQLPPIPAPPSLTHELHGRGLRY